MHEFHLVIEKSLVFFFTLRYDIPRGDIWSFDPPQLSTSWKIGEWTSVRRKMEQTINKVTNLTQHKHTTLFCFSVQKLYRFPLGTHQPQK